MTKKKLKKSLLIWTFLFIFSSASSYSQTKKPTWIWYPGDFEIWLSNREQTKRTERNAFIPPFWRLYSHQPVVNFGKKITLDQPEQIKAYVDGKYNITIDGKYVQGDIKVLTIPAGTHFVNFQVYNPAAPPSIFVQGKTIISDTSWNVELIHNNSDENIPSEPVKIFANNWNFENPDLPPSQFALPTKETPAASIKKSANSVLVDYGEETCGFVKLTGLQGTGRITFYYGESKEEALSEEFCETFDKFEVNANSSTLVSDHSRAFRFVNIVTSGSVSFKDASMLYEYLPLTLKGSFKCSDEEINKIWDVSARTLQLNTREFFYDGIKRDKWIWAGDAVQSYLMNYYSFNDIETVKRSTWALRGSDPVEGHINTILDYSLYWFTGIYDYYLYTGDKQFLKDIYPRMVTMMDFVLKRRNQQGMIEGLPGDWVFLDWAPMTKEGELSAIQLLFNRSLESMSICATIMNDSQKAQMYSELSEQLKQKINDTFWDKEKMAFIHSRQGSKLDPTVTRYPNMFALMFGYLDEKKTLAVKDNVLMNPNVQEITTPYMRFYELAALAEIGQQSYVTKQMKDYWGGMLKEGATSFWEAYNPKETGIQHLAMYGRPFGKSLCHAWGASPLYILGKYYLGVRPVKPGYEEFIVEPSLGSLSWIEGKVPAPNGVVSVFADRKTIKVNSDIKGGKLHIYSKGKPVSNIGTFKNIGNNKYELEVLAATPYVIKYKAVN